MQKSEELRIDCLNKMEEAELKATHKMNSEVYAYLTKKEATYKAWFEQVANKIKQKYVMMRPVKTRRKPGHAYYLFGDIHIGEDTPQVKANLHKMVEYIIGQPEGTVHLYCLGDLVENAVVGATMHPGQQDNLDIKANNLKTEVVETFLEMFATITSYGKRVVFHGIGGNHDRYTKARADDKRREFAQDVYMILDYYFKGTKGYNVEILRNSLELRRV